MSTTWQPLTWIIFHIFALNYKEEYREHYIIFFNSFKIIVPCSICREHYIKNTNKQNMSIEHNINSENIFNWTVDLHNNVNSKNSKKIWNYDEAKNFYQEYNFTNKLLKIFLFEYIKSNYKKNPIKTTELIRMMQQLPYLHPNIEKRTKLIEFKEKFLLNRHSFKNWLIAFTLILK